MALVYEAKSFTLLKHFLPNNAFCIVVCNLVNSLFKPDQNDEILQKTFKMNFHAKRLLHRTSIQCVPLAPIGHNRSHNGLVLNRGNMNQW